MPGNFKKEDLRITKTYKALLEALRCLLTKRSFARITVNDLCEAAQVSRAAFYAHFKDKFHLLEYWLDKLGEQLKSDEYRQMELNINDFVDNNHRLINNLIDDADHETLTLLCNFARRVFNITAQNGYDEKFKVMSTFCSGGAVYCLVWLSKSKFPSDVRLCNQYIREIITMLFEWYKSK